MSTPENPAPDPADPAPPAVAPDAPDDGPILELELAAATGIWAIRSESATVYYLDLDHLKLLRQPGVGSSTGATDGRWMHLYDAADAESRKQGVIRVGSRHKYRTDGARASEIQWWIQRRVTAIERLNAADVPLEGTSGVTPSYHVADDAEAAQLAAELEKAGDDPAAAIAVFPDGTRRPLRG